MENEKFSWGNVFWGLFLIAIGGYFLLPQIGINLDINFNLIWPFFLIGPGLGMWLNYLTSKDRQRDVGVVIPATILTVLGLLFLFQGVTNWEFAGKSAFVYPGAVALAFWLAWLLGNRHIGFLIPAVILTFATVTVFGVVNFSKLLLPFVFFFLGFIVIARGESCRPRRHHRPEHEPEMEEQQKTVEEAKKEEKKDEKK